MKLVTWHQYAHASACKPRSDYQQTRQVWATYKGAILYNTVLRNSYSFRCTFKQGRIKIFGAPRQWKNFRPLFQAVFLSGGRGGITPQTESNTTPPSPKTEITNILFYILNLWLRTSCSGLRGCDTREKEIVIWPCWWFHGRYYFYSLKFTLMFINERKRNANIYLISNFDSLEAAPSNLLP